MNAWNSGLIVGGVVLCLLAILLQGCVPLPPSLPLPGPTAASGAAPVTGVRLEVECASCGDVDLKLGPGRIDARAETPDAPEAVDAPAPEPTPAAGDGDAPDTTEAPPAASEPAPPAPERKAALPPFCAAETDCLLTGPLFGGTAAGEFNEAQCRNHPDSWGCDRFQIPK